MKEVKQIDTAKEKPPGGESLQTSEDGITADYDGGTCEWRSRSWIVSTHLP